MENSSFFFFRRITNKFRHVEISYVTKTKIKICSHNRRTSFVTSCRVVIKLARLQFQTIKRNSKIDLQPNFWLQLARTMEHGILKARKQLLWEPLRTVGKNRASCGPHCPWSNYMERSASNGSSRSSGEREKRGSGALAATESSAHGPRRKRREVARRSWNEEDDFLRGPWEKEEEGTRRIFPRSSFLTKDKERERKMETESWSCFEFALVSPRPLLLPRDDRERNRHEHLPALRWHARKIFSNLRDNVWNNVFNPI